MQTSPLPTFKRNMASALGSPQGFPCLVKSSGSTCCFCELLQRSEHPHVNSLVGATAAGSQELFQRAEPIP